MRSGRAYSGGIGALFTPHPGSPIATATTAMTTIPIAITRATPNFTRVICAPCLRIRHVPKERFIPCRKSTATKLLQASTHGFGRRPTDQLTRAHRTVGVKGGVRVGVEL